MQALGTISQAALTTEQERSMYPLLSARNEAEPKICSEMKCKKMPAPTSEPGDFLERVLLGPSNLLPPNQKSAQPHLPTSTVTSHAQSPPRPYPFLPHTPLGQLIAQASSETSKKAAILPALQERETTQSISMLSMTGQK